MSQAGFGGRVLIQRVLVAGDGPVARALAAGFERAGIGVGRWRRGETPTGAPWDAAVIAVSDRAIAEVASLLDGAGMIGPTGTAIHCAGALDPEAAFGPLSLGGRGLLHPLRAFARGAEVPPLAGTVFAVAGDVPGRSVAGWLASALGGRPLELDGAQLARYHAAAVLVGNHTLALVGQAIELLVGCGLPRAQAAEALGALLASAGANVAARGLPEALTGPIARGDAEPVARHLAALGPDRDALYRATGRALVELARGRAGSDPAKLAEIARLLAPDRSNHD